MDENVTEPGEACAAPDPSGAAPRSDPDNPTVVVIFAGLAAVFLAGVGILGLRTVAAAIGVVVASADVILLLARWWSLRRAREVGVARPSRYGILVGSFVLALLLVSIAPLVLIGGLGLPLGLTGEWLWPLRGLAVSAAGLAAIIHVSALIDWAYIRLRLLGVLGNASLPCQYGSDYSSANWSLLTRIWLAHRVGAYVLGRVALAAIIGFGIALLVTNPIQSSRSAASTQQIASQAKPAIDKQPVLSPPILAAIATVGAAILVFFINRFLPVWSLVANPRLSVGDRIVLAEEYGTGVTRRPVYYVVDVAIEGVKLLELDEGGLPKGAAGRDPKREHDRSLALIDVPRLIRVRGRFTGCDQVCSMANHNCPVSVARDVRPESDR